MPGAPSNNAPRRSRFGGLPTALGSAPPARMPAAPGATPGPALESSDPTLHVSGPPNRASPSSVPLQAEVSAQSSPPPSNLPAEVDRLDASTVGVAPEGEVHGAAPNPVESPSDRPDEQFLPPLTAAFALSATDVATDASYHEQRTVESEMGLVDLPQEPGNEVEPIFPPPPLPADEPQAPSWWARTRA